VRRWNRGYVCDRGSAPRRQAPVGDACGAAARRALDRLCKPRIDPRLKGARALSRTTSTVTSSALITDEHAPGGLGRLWSEAQYPEVQAAEIAPAADLPTCRPAHLPTCPPAHLPTCRVWNRLPRVRVQQR
jgi:hypothetical protein